MQKYCYFLSTSLLLFMIFHVIDYLFPSYVYQHILSFLGLCSIICSFILLRNRSWLFPLFLVLLAIFILSFSDHPQKLSLVWDGFREMRGLIPMIVLIPMLGWIIQRENYIKAFLFTTKGLMTSPKNVYLLLMTVMMISTFFFSLGSILLLFTLGAALLAKLGDDWLKEKDTIIIQGFALSSIWSLTEPSMVYSLEATKAPVLLTIGLGLILSIIGMALGLLFFQSRSIKINKSFNFNLLETSYDGSPQKAKLLVLELFIILIGFYALILIGLKLLQMPVIHVMPLAILISTLLYFMFKKDYIQFAKNLKEYSSNGIGRKSRELGYLLSAGLVIIVLVETQYGEQLFTTLINWSNNVPFMSVLFILPLVIVLLGFIGLPPTPSMVLIAAVIVNTPIEYSPTVLVLTLLAGCTLSFLISPVTMPSLILSSLNNRSPFQNGFKKNFWYAVSFYIVAELYIYMIGWLGI